MRLRLAIWQTEAFVRDLFAQGLSTFGKQRKGLLTFYVGRASCQPQWKCEETEGKNKWSVYVVRSLLWLA